MRELINLENVYLHIERFNLRMGGWRTVFVRDLLHPLTNVDLSRGWGRAIPLVIKIGLTRITVKTC